MPGGIEARKKALPFEKRSKKFFPVGARASNTTGLNK
jgi:hypothetical protein